MSKQWKPGDLLATPLARTVARIVALVQNEFGVWNRAICLVGTIANEWQYGVSRSTALMNAPARPLVVIDPEDREEVERLASACRAAFGWRTGADENDVTQTQAALREFADPKPPRLEEPGPWGVVEATASPIPRRRWVHHEEDRWISDSGDIRYWDDLSDPVLVREGVQP